MSVYHWFIVGMLCNAHNDCEPFPAIMVIPSQDASAAKTTSICQSQAAYFTAKAHPSKNMYFKALCVIEDENGKAVLPSAIQ